jgi:hypothetical protein
MPAHPLTHKWNLRYYFTEAKLRQEGQQVAEDPARHTFPITLCPQPHAHSASERRSY